MNITESVVMMVVDAIDYFGDEPWPGMEIFYGFPFDGKLYCSNACVLIAQFNNVKCARFDIKIGKPSVKINVDYTHPKLIESVKKWFGNDSSFSVESSLNESNEFLPSTTKFTVVPENGNHHSLIIEFSVGGPSGQFLTEPFCPVDRADADADNQ